MVFHNKIVYLISDAYTENSLITKLDEQDYLITISITGTFAHAAIDYIQQNSAYKALVTVCRDDLFKKHYDIVYHLSAKDRAHEGRTVYGKYGISYMFDVIYSAYVRKYGNLSSKNERG